jgi:orotidine-5'-phosphate decarboxylase
MRRVKPQLACFERLGAPGWLALEHVCLRARGGLLVLADGKRGDVPVTAAAYGQALVGGTPSPFGMVSGLEADAFTANPLLGRDALEPLIAAARARGAGPSCSCARRTRARPTSWTRDWRPASSCGSASRASSRAGRSRGGARPARRRRRRHRRDPAGAPRAPAGADAAHPVPAPGHRRQGGDVARARPGIRARPRGRLVTASRSIANAHEQAAGAPEQAARAEAERLREQAWALR